MGTIHTDADGIPIVRADGAIKAKLLPAGFLKITKEAIDRIMTAHPELCYGEKYNLSLDLFNHGAHKGLWWGEDYAFCRRWEAMGEDAWLVPDLDLDHYTYDNDGRSPSHSRAIFPYVSEATAGRRSMAAIYLRHPTHGTKVAVSEDEAKYDATNGWKRYTPFTSPVTAETRKNPARRRVPTRRRSVAVDRRRGVDGDSGGAN